MERIEDYSDDRLKVSCIHCGKGLSKPLTSRDHVPSKGFLNKPYPENLPQIPICHSCNNSFSLDEEYMMAFLSAVLCGSTAPEDQVDERVGRMLARNAKLRIRIERSKQEYETLGGDIQLIWRPEQTRIGNVVVKNARGHAFFEFGEPIFGKPSSVASIPLSALGQRRSNSFERFETGELQGWPEVGSRMMQRMMTRQDMVGDWVIVQSGTYRYAVLQGPPTIVRTVIHEYLATEVIWQDN